MLQLIITTIKRLSFGKSLIKDAYGVYIDKSKTCFLFDPGGDLEVRIKHYYDVLLPPVLLLGWIALTAGCVTNPSGVDDAAENTRLVHQINLANWDLCQRAYKENNQHTYHTGHLHRANGQILGESAFWAIKSDLIDNRCRQILRVYWLEGGSY
jgi:hypothetical protein